MLFTRAVSRKANDIYLHFDSYCNFVFEHHSDLFTKLTSTAGLKFRRAKWQGEGLKLSTKTLLTRCHCASVRCARFPRRGNFEGTLVVAQAVRCAGAERGAGRSRLSHWNASRASFPYLRDKKSSSGKRTQDDAFYLRGGRVVTQTDR